MALNNMKGEIRRSGVTQRQIAESMEMSETNFSLKLNERIPMTVDEAKFIRNKWLKGSSLDYLLESDGDLPSERERSHSCIDALGDSFARCMGESARGQLTPILEGMHKDLDEAFAQEAG